MGPWAPGIWVGAPVVFSDAADDTWALLTFTHWWLSIQGIRAAAREVVHSPPVVGPIAGPLFRWGPLEIAPLEAGAGVLFGIPEGTYRP